VVLFLILSLIKALLGNYRRLAYVPRFGKQAWKTFSESYLRADMVTGPGKEEEQRKGENPL
jgi:hypothetical protein